ncbi:uncharacterized protein LOC103717062 isoform X1 [Phoenix dactylifera]|uniref:Uncharacterized protein LOC103717062 isoform X1 n=1 Tax=Phoenix dactylifera TaxID=42345 RepID=A0A8B7CPQ6_PHODC|nr:uncharacterized protein LOC103717062 isoform X1 [Phoenix dactylifera]
MALADGGDGGREVHVVEVNDEEEAADEISPLLVVEAADKPTKMTIFSVSYPKKRPLKEPTLRAAETDSAFLSQIILWVWNGSRYSGFLCMACSSTIYYIMDVLVDIFQVLLNFATPIIALIGAKIVLREKLALSDFGGVGCSFMGLLFIFQPLLTKGGGSTETGQTSDALFSEGTHIYPILVGILSTVLGGVSYCLIRAGAKASDQPAYTVFSFGVLACPLSAACTFAFQGFVLPNPFTFLLMVILGVLAFFAEMFLARGLQLEKIGKATNILYIKVFLSQVWSMTFLGTTRSFNILIGCFLILASVCSTIYLGPEKENE